MTPARGQRSGSSRDRVPFRRRAGNVIAGHTGVFFDEPTTESLVASISDFETRSWDSMALRQHAEKFSALYSLNG